MIVQSQGVRLYNAKVALGGRLWNAKAADCAMLGISRRFVQY